MQHILMATVIVAAVVSLGMHPASWCETADKAQHNRQAAMAKDNDAPLRDRHADARAMVSQLQTVRSQISLYGNQHNGKLPNIERYGWDQLTGETNAQGRTPAEDETGYGPYLRNDAVNPLTGSSGVCTLGWIDPEAGWAYDLSTGMIYAVVSQHDAQKFGLRTCLRTGD